MHNQQRDTYERRSGAEFEALCSEYGGIMNVPIVLLNEPIFGSKNPRGRSVRPFRPRSMAGKEAGNGIARAVINPPRPSGGIVQLIEGELMGRPKVYENDAARKRAHRNKQRLAAGKPLPLTPAEQRAAARRTDAANVADIRAMLIKRGRADLAEKMYPQGLRSPASTNVSI